MSQQEDLALPKATKSGSARPETTEPATAAESSRRARPPEWFTRAVQTPFEEHSIQVAGCRVHYQCWGRAGRPGLMLVHGGFAHAHWWDFIAPFFAEHFRVSALDLSGMGDSEYRRQYTREIFAEEIIEVCAAAGFSDRPIVIGHSFGGYLALQAGALHGEKLAGVIVVDFPIRPTEVQREHEANRPLIKQKEVYPRLEAALDRFRLIPAQPCDNTFILDYIARHSVTQVKGGWSWKFDDQVFEGFDLGNVPEALEKVSCRLAVIYGEKSDLFPEPVVRYMCGLLEQRAPMIRLAGLHHHLFLEQPFVFIDTVNRLLAQWGYNIGTRKVRPDP